MSRHTIAALHSQHTCVVGYDPPLGTFFAQLWDQSIPAAEEQVVLWVGTTLEEIPTVQALATALQELRGDSGRCLAGPGERTAHPRLSPEPRDVPHAAPA